MIYLFIACLLAVFLIGLNLTYSAYWDNAAQITYYMGWFAFGVFLTLRFVEVIFK